MPFSIHLKDTLIGSKPNRYMVQKDYYYAIVGHEF